MYLFQIIYLFLPAGISNMIPPLVAPLFPKLNQPLDFHQKYRGQRIFGDHKTIRGIIAGTISAGLFFLIQQQLYLTSDFAKDLSLINYTDTSLFFGLSIGFGALLGDAIKSFFKRQLSIRPGSSWFPWDQIDWVIGSLFLSSLFINITPHIIITYLIVGLGLHLLVKAIGFTMKINDTAI